MLQYDEFGVDPVFGPSQGHKRDFDLNLGKKISLNVCTWMQDGTNSCDYESRRLIIEIFSAKRTKKVPVAYPADKAT